MAWYWPTQNGLQKPLNYDAMQYAYTTYNTKLCACGLLNRRNRFFKTEFTMKKTSEKGLVKIKFMIAQ